MALPSAGPTDCSSGLSNRVFNNLRYDNPWQASQSGVAVGTLCCPTVPNGFGYRCSAITTGITGNVEPTWPLVLTNTVVDGGVTWTAQDVANPSGKAHNVNFGYVFTAADLDGFRLLAYNTAKAVADEIAADNEAWTGFTYTNAWSNAGIGQVGGYMKDANGRVWARGRAKSPGVAAGVSIQTFPVGYRPALLSSFGIVILLATGAYAAGQLDVGADGTCKLYPATVVNDIYSFDGISFDTR